MLCNYFFGSPSKEFTYSLGLSMFPVMQIMAVLVLSAKRG